MKIRSPVSVRFSLAAAALRRTICINRGIHACLPPHRLCEAGRDYGINTD
jgi:hypothetical protein